MIRLLILFSVNAGCSNVSQSPKMIEGDGQNYMACSGLIWVTDDGFFSTSSFTLEYTDQSGLTRKIRGLKKVEVSDVPKMVYAAMPLNPAMTDKNGMLPKHGKNEIL